MLSDRKPLGRMLAEDDFYGTVAYFSSDMSQNMNGQNLSIDDGWKAW